MCVSMWACFVLGMWGAVGESQRQLSDVQVPSDGAIPARIAWVIGVYIHVAWRRLQWLA